MKKEKILSRLSVKQPQLLAPEILQYRDTLQIVEAQISGIYE